MSQLVSHLVVGVQEGPATEAPAIWTHTYLSRSNASSREHAPLRAPVNKCSQWLGMPCWLQVVCNMSRVSTMHKGTAGLTPPGRHETARPLRRMAVEQDQPQCRRPSCNLALPAVRHMLLSGRSAPLSAGSLWPSQRQTPCTAGAAWTLQQAKHWADMSEVGAWGESGSGRAGMAKKLQKGKCACA